MFESPFLYTNEGVSCFRCSLFEPGLNKYDTREQLRSSVCSGLSDATPFIRPRLNRYNWKTSSIHLFCSGSTSSDFLLIARLQPQTQTPSMLIQVEAQWKQGLRYQESYAISWSLLETLYAFFRNCLTKLHLHPSIHPSIISTFSCIQGCQVEIPFFFLIEAVQVPMRRTNLHPLHRSRESLPPSLTSQHFRPDPYFSGNKSCISLSTRTVQNLNIITQSNGNNQFWRTSQILQKRKKMHSREVYRYRTISQKCDRDTFFTSLCHWTWCTGSHHQFTSSQNGTLPLGE